MRSNFFQSLQGVDLFVFWFLAIFIMGLAFSPTTFFALFTGYIWGLNGLIPLIIAYSLASLLGFFVAKLFKGEAILTFIKSKFKSASFLDHVQSNSFSWVFLARLSPVFPFSITNAIMAFLGVSIQKFFIEYGIQQPFSCIINAAFMAGNKENFFWLGDKVGDIQAAFNKTFR